MENERAIEIIKAELRHCQIHMKDKNKASDYYQELSELCEAYEIAIKALESSSSIPLFKQRALAIVDVYSDANVHLSQRDAEILRKAILF